MKSSRLINLPKAPQLHHRSAAPTQLSRRRLLQGGFILSTSIILGQADHASAVADVVSFKDDSTGLELSYPTDWVQGEVDPDQQYISERTLVWYPKGISPAEVNVSLLINNASADFTSLGSFGTAEQFGTTLVNSMDQSYKARGYRRAKERNLEFQSATLLDAKSKGGIYSIEYLMKKPKEEARKLESLVALGFDGKYNRLFTLTAQCPESEYSKYEKAIDTFLDSFKPPGIKK